MKINIITGGSRGLGRSIALHAADRGQDSIITYNTNKTEADKVVSEITAKGRKAVALQLDVSKPASFDAFVGEVKKALSATWNTEKFDHLVNNAGIGMYTPIVDVTEEKWDEIMTIHLKSPYFLTQKLLPVMNDGGKIINVSSGLARFSMPGSSTYAMMKGGIEVFTRYLAKELGARKISANTLAPGAIETDFGGGRVRDSKDMNAMIAGQTALGRVGLPDDIGAIGASMLSDDFRWVNGQRVEASGGFFL
ncbi:SDR family NAD(P)-dependent oxidoreductase [Aestuariivirga litoralis]|uniref:SDR family NAD(P)-dependent oxidoreductase n=1 Tax=Aestuariivirga litoralis TaxID=2650924 RepID=UPI0018C5EA0B|nr:SDR family oxidoreductase [Aestuariivirga litoralis]MBG1233307.1 SDR family oxidoreductase [Aestuariivirga litoralis]